MDREESQVKAKMALECAELLKSRFEEVYVDASKAEAVVHARGHQTAFRYYRCFENTHVGPILRVRNVTAVLDSGTFGRPEPGLLPRKYSEITYCRKCEKVLAFEKEERI
jgi:hypothetical protein